MQPRTITVFLLAWWTGASHAFRLTMQAKGFGAPRTAVGASSLLPLTRPSEHRRVEGAFAKLLAQVSTVFEGLRPTEGVSKDVYVRVAMTGNSSSLLPFVFLSFCTIYICPLTCIPHPFQPRNVLVRRQGELPQQLRPVRGRRGDVLRSVDS